MSKKSRPGDGTHNKGSKGLAWDGEPPQGLWQFVLGLHRRLSGLRAVR